MVAFMLNICTGCNCFSTDSNEGRSLSAESSVKTAAVIGTLAVLILVSLVSLGGGILSLIAIGGLIAGIFGACVAFVSLFSLIFSSIMFCTALKETCHPASKAAGLGSFSGSPPRSLTPLTPSDTSSEEVVPILFEIKNKGCVPLQP